MTAKTDYETIVSAVTVRHRGDSFESETATTVRLKTEGGGAFVEADQSAALAEDLGKIHITPEEWPQLRRAINRMIRIAQKEPT